MHPIKEGNRTSGGKMNLERMIAGSCHVWRENQRSGAYQTSCRDPKEVVSLSVDVQFQPTPNPNSLKFIVNQTVVESGSESYMDAEAAQKSPLAAALFELDGVASVFMLGNFITVNKKAEAAWEDLAPAITEVITNQLSN